MHFSILKFVAIALLSAVFAVMGMFRNAFRTGENPSDDGPRAFIAQSVGLWIGMFLCIWSFTVDGKTLQWTLRGTAIFAAVVGLGLSAFFANTTEVPETPDKEPTGLKNNTTSLHLE
jgi:cell division protein FtsW (lipid II flippase)